MPSRDDKYADPELRNEVKEEVRASDKGGAPGQWSARKAQMMASEYKRRGGGYTTDKGDEKAQQLDNWTEEKERTEHKKQDGSKEGRHYITNTSKAKSAKKDTYNDVHHKDGQSESQLGTKEAQSCTHHWEDEEFMKNGQKAYQEFKKKNRNNAASSEEAQTKSGSAHGADDQEHSTPKKRGCGANAPAPNKKQKKNGSSDEPNGAAGDKTRVPKVGQKVQWKALPGFVDGEVVEIAYEEKNIEGKAVKASKEDPRVVLKSSSSGKIAVHKPEAVYFS